MDMNYYAIYNTIKYFIQDVYSRSSAFEISRDTSNDEDTESPRTESRNWESFLERVESFSTVNWFAKPDEFSPLQCARFGWKNIDKDLLQCVRCKVFLSGQLPLVVDNDVYNNIQSKITSLSKPEDPKSCSKLQNGLQDVHEKFCPWPANPSPASFAEIPLFNKDILIEDFKKRMTALADVGKHIPEIDPNCFNDWNITDLHVSFDSLVSYVKDKTDLECDDDSVFKGLTWFAVCGWSGINKSKNTIMCPVCRRQVGLWNYTSTVCEHSSDSDDSENIIPGSSCTDESKDDASSLNESSSEPQRKKRKLEKKEYFNPLAEHRSWCPWIKVPVRRSQISADVSSLSPQNQTNHDQEATERENRSDTEEPSWLLSLRILIAHLPPEAKGSPLSRKLKTSPPLEGLRHIRRMLKDWSSPMKKASEQP